jgi:hypothetical protein
MKNYSTKLKAQIEEYKNISDALGAEQSKSATIRHIIFWLAIIAIAVVIYYWFRVSGN